MPTTQYCWRCQNDMPMLDETEWAQMEPLLKDYVAKIKEARAKNIPMEQAHRMGLDKRALELYFKFTGYREFNIMNVWHHRTKLYGAPCPECGKPLRTPKAKLCAHCGTYREV